MRFIAVDLKTANSRILGTNMAVRLSAETFPSEPVAPYISRMPGGSEFQQPLFREAFGEATA